MKKVPNKMAEKWQFEVFCINGFLEHTADKLSVQTMKLLGICPERAGTGASYIDNGIWRVSQTIEKLSVRSTT